MHAPSNNVRFVGGDTVWSFFLLKICVFFAILIVLKSYMKKGTTKDKYATYLCKISVNRSPQWRNAMILG